ncbi:flagellar biosynthesis protein FlhF [Goodfellowiella coeruleoviolacea]|uniref:ABC transporter substrate-binding protein n=1 Tax=Goodfellowiella coeruleoviolacea TaxID=334858 RepID=A0AAE3G9I9_9PSEU|nr:ABC transporter substrate-binding protein [Goodfellowiella coeruleoviolacea]MCP2163374.1 hypothetical protein [Goodfellowiella coeruleoviolacea]
MTAGPRRALGVVAAVLVVAATAPHAHAVDQSRGRPGFCTSDTGVTVVVDFQQLGGTTLVRCNPQATSGTGLDALKGAGFQLAGTQRWGEGFVCRIENRPSAVEEIPIEGDTDYRESCVDTPPASGYWSYWHAANGCAWEYSQWGLKNRAFIQGGFEGWSFSLNATADTNPAPRIAAVRPGTEGQPCGGSSDEGRPSSTNPNEQQGDVRPNPAEQNSAQRQQPPPGGTAAPDTPGPATASGADPAALPPPKPRPSAGTPAPAPDPDHNVAFAGGENAPDVNEVLRQQSGASRYAPWAAAGLVVLLVVAALLTARRRGRARDS